MAPIPLLLLTQRRALRSLFDHPGQPGDPRFALTRLRLSEDALQGDERAVAQAAGAVIDAVPEPALAVRVARQLHDQRPDLPILALVCCLERLPPSFIQALLDAGVQGFQDLSEGRHVIQQTLVDLQHGQMVFRLEAPPLAGHSLADVLPGWQTPVISTPGRVTPREQAVLQRLNEGLTEEEIAHREQISVSTLKREIVHLEAKLGAATLFQLGARAKEQGLLA